MITTLASWYFVAWFGHPLAYVGPMPADKCEQIAAIAGDLGRCRRANYMMACDVAGQPGSTMACPAFDPEPTITVKSKGEKE